MLSHRVIPCLDVTDGRVVKGIRFHQLRDAGSPVDLAARYECEGADELVVLDVTATTASRDHALDTVRAIRRVLSIPLTVGGGIRGVADAVAILEAGADKVAVNSAAHRDPELLTALAQRFGSQCITLSIDARAHHDGWTVVVRAGTEETARSAEEWAATGESLGAGEILLTSIDRDGTRSGYDVALLRSVAGSVGVPIVASGGARAPEDMVDAVAAGASAVLAASMFHDGDVSIAETKRVLRAAGVEVRL